MKKKVKLSPEILEKFKNEEMVFVKGGLASIPPITVNVNCGSAKCNDYCKKKL